MLCLLSGRAASAQPPPDVEAGKAAYQQSCARCHGVAGRGDGVDAKRFYPRPRDLTLGVYKFRSTASGTPPTDEDLFRTISRGLPGSNMPDWQQLDEKVRWQLVYYLKSLSPLFEQSTPEPVAVAPDPGPSRADLSTGRALYEKLGCAACHGAQGRANGTSAAGLVDDWGMSIRPANLTQGWNYRGWSDPASIMLRVLTGIDGAGMPSYTGALSPEETWHLAYYVASLQEAPHWNRVAHASYTAGPLPQSLDDPRWQAIERTDVRLRNAVTADGAWATPPTVNAVSVQIMYNDEAAAFRLTWHDPSGGQQTPPDALALLLKPEAVRGDVVTLQAWPYEGAPALDVCYWSADHQRAQEAVTVGFDQVRDGRGSLADVESAAAYADGRWQVVLHRPLQRPQLAGAAVIVPSEWSAIALAVWDGGNPDAQAVSPWLDVEWQSVKERLTKRQKEESQ
jgi:cytochrome c oxidase cbb3-type subunit 2